MLPVLRVVIGDVRVHLSLHATAILLGVVAGAVVAVRRARVPAPAMLAAVAGVAAAALGGARALFGALHGLAPSGGLVSVGGIATGLAAVPCAVRLTGGRPADLMDALVPAGLLALAIGRVGCLLAGCCFGTPTALPWGVVLPELGPPARHPLPLYEAAGDVAVLVLLAGRSAAPGLTAARVLLGYGLLRAALETLRDAAAADPLAGPVTLAGAAALVLALAALVAARRLRRRGAVRYACRPEDSAAWRTRSR